MKLIDDTLRSTWRRLGRLWRPMAAWTLVVWAALAVALAPVSSAILGWGGLRGRRSVVGNEEILAWVLSPPGLVWVLLAGSLALMTWVIRFAGLFRIITDDLEEGSPPGLRRIALDLAPHLPALLRLCLVTVVAGIAVAAPLFGGLAAIRALFLGAYDINYYLAERPEAWRWGMAAAGAWLFAWALPVAYLAARSLLAVPAYLDGHRPLRAALRRSWRRTGGSASRLLRLLAAAVLAWLALRALAGAAFAAAGAAALTWLGDISTSLRPLVLATAVYLAGLAMLDAVIAFLGFSFVATLVTKFYYEDTDLHALAPALPRIRDLPRRAVHALRVWLRPGRVLTVAALLAAASVLASGLLLERIPDLEPPGVIAHRAGPPPAPENTLAALERAIAAGADWSEIDVQRTGDGVVVVVHDADLMRMAGDPRRVRRTRYAELADVVQAPDDGSPASERRLATLAEFLERSRGRIGLVIELKYYGPDPRLADAVVREVRAQAMERDVVIMSLDLPAVEQVLALAPEITTGYVAAATVGAPSRLPVAFLAVSRTRLTPRLLRHARERGLDLHAWTVNRAPDMADLIERGVHGLITDAPVLAVRVRAELADLSPAARLLLRVRNRLPGVDEG